MRKARLVHWEERCYYCEECGKEVSFHNQLECVGCGMELDWENIVILPEED